MVVRIDFLRWRGMGRGNAIGREGVLSVGAAPAGGPARRAFSRRFETQRPSRSVWRLRAIVAESRRGILGRVGTHRERSGRHGGRPKPCVPAVFASQDTLSRSASGPPVLDGSRASETGSRRFW